MNPTPRRGAVLIIVVGLSVALLGLCMTFLVRMRADANISSDLIKQAQARCMLLAACTYIQECSRIGFGQEGYGWRDIRDGSDPRALPGPRGFDGVQLPNDGAGTWLVNPAAQPLHRWPAVGGVARCLMKVPVLPPWATKGRYAYNPVERRWPNVNPDISGGEVRYNNLSPQPATFPDQEPSGVWRYETFYADDADDGRMDGIDGYAGAWEAFSQGSRVTPDDPSSLLLRDGGAEAWFRVYREGVDTFIITVGTGATRGYRDWAEVNASGDAAVFLSDRTLFRESSIAERRQWYRVQWSPSISGRSMVYAQQRSLGLGSTAGEQEKPPAAGYEMTIPNWDPGGRGEGVTVSSHYQSQDSTYETNHMGTIRFIERLLQEPTAW